MRVLSVASELYPLVKTGGLADVAGALPAALAPLNVEMRTLVPGYPAVLRAIADADTVHADPALFGGPARLLAAEIAGLSVFVLDAPHLYDRPGLYGGLDGDWPDNPIRFAALCRVAAQIGQGLLPAWRPDVVHAHDWQAGLIAAYLHYDGSTRPGTVFTVHNLAFQGQADRSLLQTLGLPPHAWDIEGVEHNGTIGFLKAGLRLSDRITTVSPTYADEIRSPSGGMGLDGLLRARGDTVSGILNGIDTAIWNPAADPALAARYDGDHLPARAANKQALQARLGLDPDPQAPVFGVISRLSWQKGLDLLLATLPTILAGGGQIALLGSGDAAIESGFASAALSHPGRVGLLLGFDEHLAHLMQGGSDLIVVPSRFEPCGLTQLCALRYGAVPLVARVGGLADTIIDANWAALAAGAATGLQFAPPEPAALNAAIGRALQLWHDPPLWQRTQRAAMAFDTSWNRSAEHYRALYHEAARSRSQ